MIKGGALLLSSVLALAVVPAPALARPGDIATTRAYIQANYVLVHTGSLNVGPGEAALQSLLQQVRGECPNVAAGSPENKDAEQLSEEVIGAMTIDALHPAVQAVAIFTQDVASLHWSNSKLTRKVASYVSKLEGLSALAAPNLCADVKSWAADGYQALSASTVQFDQRFSAVDVALGEVPSRLLTPYERPVEKSILRRTHGLEGLLTEAEARAVTPWGQILDALSLNP
jgi:hypothetical protein